MRTRGSSGRLAPLRIAAFRPLAFAYTVNEAGNWLGDVALAVLVYDHTGSAAATALLFVAARFVPALIAPLLVARLETGRTRVVLASVYALEVPAFVALALVAGRFSLAAVAALAVLDGALALSGRALVRAAVVAVTSPAGRLREANALLNLGFTAAAAAGPAVAAAVVAALGVSAALLIDGCSFLVAALALALARSLPSRLAGYPEPARGRLARVRAGARHVRHRPAIAALLSAQGIAFVFFSAVIPVEVVFVKGTLAAGDLGYGAFLSAWGVGMLVGGAAFAFGGRLPLRTVAAAGTGAIATAYIGIALAPSLAAACAAATLGGVGNGVQWVALINWLQELTAARYQARVMALLESVAAVMPGIGFVLGGALTAAFSPRVAFLLAGVGVAAVLAGAATVLARGERAETATAADEPGTAAAAPSRSAS